MNDGEQGNFDMEIGPVISPETAEALLLGYSNANKGKILDSKEFGKILKWAEEVEVGNALLSGIIKGQIEPSVNTEGEVVFGVTEKGKDIIRGKTLELPFLPFPDKDKVN